MTGFHYLRRISTLDCPSASEVENVTAVKMSKARAYQSLTPANNMILKKRWDQTRFHMHRTKVRISKAMIDNKPPENYMHLHLKRKKVQMEEERQQKVRRDNQILLDKMSHIMRTRGSVDHRNNYQQRSLNKTRRQRDLLRVTHENQAILKRIQAKEPHYNHHQWHDQWRVNRGYMINISKYPNSWMHGEKQSSVEKQMRRGAAELKQLTGRKRLLRTSDTAKAQSSSAANQPPDTIPPVAS